MLEELIVDNLGLIEHAQVELGPGLVVVTGETGAGKTLLLGALGLVVGGTARRDLIGPKGDEATVQARFDVDGEERVVIRRLSSRGRSRGYLDGAMASAGQLAETGRAVVEIVGQHDHLRLVSGRHVRAILDESLDTEGRRAVEAYQAAYADLETLRSRAAQLGGDRHGLERELDMCRFQAEEIETAAISPGEDAELARAASRHRNATAIGEALSAAHQGLGEDGIEPLLDQVLLALERAAALDPENAQLARQALDIAGLVGDLRTDVGIAAVEIDGDPGELERLERRIARLGELQRKYGDTAADVIAFGDAAAQRAAELTELLSSVDELDESLARATAAVERTGAALTTQRVRTGERIAAAAVDHLRELGFAQPVVEFAVTSQPAGPSGCDRIELRFASSVELDARPVGRIASGGELSRLVLAIRLAAGGSDRHIATFDEIDAGVGGAAALALGQKLAGLAERRQVLCVTHLPQVAAHATTHVVVSRDGDTTLVEVVDGERRIEELTRMLAGMPDSERGREHAAELLARSAAAGS